MRPASSDTGNPRQTTRLLLACGVMGPPLFIWIFLIEGVTSPGYRAWRNSVSQLDLSEQGGIQIANFLVTGMPMLCFVAGLRQAMPNGGDRHGDLSCSPYMDHALGAPLEGYGAVICAARRLGYTRTIVWIHKARSTIGKRHARRSLRCEQSVSASSAVQISCGCTRYRGKSRGPMRCS